VNGYNFTDHVRKVLQIAREEAQRRGHKNVDTGHLLLAIIDEAEGTGAKALARLAVDVAAVRRAIEDAMRGKGTGTVAGPDVPYTRASMDVLERAMTEARELRHTYLGTEHLLLGLLREEKGILGWFRAERSIAAQTLGSAGVTLEAARAAIVILLAQEMPVSTRSLSASHVVGAYNFTDRVRKVLQMAREEAARLRHEFVGTEHILLGLIREGEGIATAVLTNLNVELDDIERRIEATVIKGKAARAAGPELPYTGRAKKVLEMAMAETRELDHSYVGTEHLLLGLLREEKGIAAQVLTDCGVTLEHARRETLRLLGSEMPSGAQEQGRGAEILTRMRALVSELHGTPAPDASRLRAVAAELNGLLDELARTR
jgi:ATP-dependent Clp protease ATP-binding subunit ClpA